MFRFFHGYLPKVWEAQEKAGLIRVTDGVRFVQSPTNHTSLRFNSLAKKDSDLYNLIKERRIPLYIDRLQGGDYYDEYPYDFKLIEEYKRMLGNDFWGFQMHEWVSNYRTDILRKLKDVRLWKEANIIEEVLKQYPSKNGRVFLESASALEIQDLGRPKNLNEFLKIAFTIYKRRQQAFGDLIPCDSSILAYNFELMSGAKRVMPEVGAQTPNARLQICYARGMTRTSGRSFGIYYEPWGGKPFGTCNYHNNDLNEWGVTAGGDFPFRSYGESGGSSRSLQKRIMLYAFLSGAEFISEEWGLYNTFYDMESFELTPYGRAKKQFIDFVNKFTDIGEKLAPVGVVIPKDMYVLDDIFDPNKICGFDNDSYKFAKAKIGVQKIFASSKDDCKLGTEVDTLRNSVIPDGVDLLNEDDALVKNYDFLVDLTGDRRFANSHSNIIDRKHIVDALRHTLPCFVEGKAHWMVNKCTRGGYYVTIFNHSGINRTVKDGESAMDKAKISVKLYCNAIIPPKLVDGFATMTAYDGYYEVRIPAGEWAFIKF